MKSLALPAALVVVSAATPAVFAGDTPPMDVMGPYDTPASAAGRIVLPGADNDFGLGRDEAGIENARAAPPELPPGLELQLPFADAQDIARTAKDPKPGKDDRDKDDRDKDDGRKGKD